VRATADAATGLARCTRQMSVTCRRRRSGSVGACPVSRFRLTGRGARPREALADVIDREMGRSATHTTHVVSRPRTCRC
jgi:hypothetical protein